MAAPRARRSGRAGCVAGSESQNADWRVAHGPNRARVEPALGCEPFVAAVAWRVPAERGVAQGGVTRSATGRA
jgi:hypothetical protein